MSKVALIPCPSYDEEQVFRAVSDGIALLGGITEFVRPDEKILLKPNLLSGAAPEKAITTHPSVFGAVARVLKDAGCTDLSYGDSPGTPRGGVEENLRRAGLLQMAEKCGVRLADFEHCHQVTFTEGKHCKSFMISNAVTEADALINVCKMKTHALERLTGAVKNHYGLICGTNKALGHVQYPNKNVFADMLVDLNRFAGTRLHVMDGIVAMEGNGPASGTPVDMGLILISDDAVALDSVFAGLVHLDPKEVPTCVSGDRDGLGTMDYAKIEILTPDGTLTMEQAAEKYGKKDFSIPRGGGLLDNLFFVGFLRPLLREKPVVDPAKCIGCGVCQEACPVEGKAVHSGSGKKAEYDYKKCIRCFCCQEMCPVKAISVKRGPGKKPSGKER